MAGHSKWKNIQHRKGRQDAIRGKLFAKLAKEIYVAARQGDADPNHNQRLRLAISKAKANNMPNDNIDRALKKAAGGGDGQNYEEIMYEGYGPGGIAIMVEALTDNRNRTAADVRHIFSKRGGNLGEAGCVSWMFARKGLLSIHLVAADLDEEQVVLTALESGVEDFETNDGIMEMTTVPDQLEEAKNALEQAGIVVDEAEVTFVPENKIYLDGELASEVVDLLEALEEHDDVQNVFANIDVAEDA